MKQIFLIALVACGSTAPAPAVPSTPPPEAPAPIAIQLPEPAPAVGNPVQSLIPRSVLFGTPERTNVQISPDGKQLAWLAPKDGVMNVWIAPLGRLDQAKPVTADTKRPIRGYQWAYTNKHLLYWQDNGGDENFHVFRVDLAGGKTVDLTPYPNARASIDGLSDAAPKTIAVSINDRDPKLFDEYTIDLDTGARTLLVLNDGGFGAFVLDAQLHPRFATKSLPDGGSEIYVTDVLKKPSADGKLAWKLFDKVPFEDASGTGVVGVAPGGKSVYMTDTRASDTGAVVAIDIATKKRTPITTDPKAEAGDTIVDPHTGKLQAIAFDYLRTRWQVIDKTIAADLAGIAKLAPGDIGITSRSQDDRLWIVTTSSEQKPGDYWLWDRTSHKGTFLLSARPDLAHYQMAAMTPVEIPARDGLTLVSYVTRAHADKVGPMVLVVHGGPWSRDSWGYHALTQLFANRGYAVLSVNFRGSTGFGKKFLNAGNLQWGKRMHDDLLDAVAWAKVVSL